MLVTWMNSTKIVACLVFFNYQVSFINNKITANSVNVGDA
jgi:hypothetical protein